MLFAGSPKTIPPFWNGEKPNTSLRIRKDGAGNVKSLNAESRVENKMFHGKCY